jgi:uncharacterized membrane protein
MTLRRLSFLQWFGLLAGGVTWFSSFLAGVGTAMAVCNPAGARWGIPYDTVQAALAIAAALMVVAALVASITVFRATRNVGEQDPPPQGRLHFLATASLLGNCVFLLIILLSAIATIVDRTCHQA